MAALIVSVAMPARIYAQPALKRALFYGPTSAPAGLAETFVNSASLEFAPIGPGAADSKVWTEAEWLTKTTTDFAAFDIIVFGDQPNGTQDASRWNTAIANRSVWSAAVTGNALIFGGDPDQPTHPGAPVVQSAMRFGADQSGYSQHVTGIYVAFSQVHFGNFFGGVRTPEAVELLKGIGVFMALDAFNPSGWLNCADAAFKIATHPVLDCLSDTDLSNWTCSAHQGFHSWPSTFLPLAIVRGVDSPTPGYTPPCDSYAGCGTPALVYILARGNFNQLTVTPCVQAGSPTESLTVTAQFKTNPGGVPIAGRRIGFQVTGANAGATGVFVPPSRLTDGNGEVSFTYSGTIQGKDIVLVFLDDDGDNSPDACEGQTTAICNRGSTIVTVTAPDPDATESGDPGKFRFSRSGSTAGDLDVYFCLTGTAGEQDYDLSSPSSQVTIPDGAGFAEVTVTPEDDSIPEGPETVIVTLRDADQGTYVVGLPFQAAVTIYDDEAVPIVSLSSSGDAAEEGPSPSTVTVTRSVVTAQFLDVYFTLPTAPGAALLGSDYQLSMDGHITIDAGQASGSMVLTPFQDSRNEGTEVATVQLLAHPSYQLGSPATLGVNILDNDNVTLPLSYFITSLGPLNKASQAFGINDAGVVVGAYKIGPHTWRGFSWNNGTLTTIGIPNGDPGCTLSTSAGCGSSYAFGINASGLVVGYGYGEDDVDWPFRWTSGMPDPLEYLAGGQAFGNYAAGINSGGYTVGSCPNNLGKTRAVFWSAGMTAAQDWETLAGFDPAKESFATGINGAGKVVGKSMIQSDNSAYHAFRTRAFAPIQFGDADDLGNLVGGEGVNSEATWINDLDEVVGATIVASGQYHAFWKDGHSVKHQAFVDLGVLAGDNLSMALGLNMNGHAVGYSQNTASGSARAVVWFNNGLMWDLNVHLSNGSGWTLYSAEAINGSGSIVGWGIKSGLLRAFLLVPNN